MKSISIFTAGILSFLLLTTVAAQDQPFDNDKFLEDLRNKYTDFNWVNLDEDLVLIGELDSIDYCELRYGEVDSGPFVPHARAGIRPCRWIVGNDDSDPVLYYASVVYLDADNNISRQEIAGEPWMIPGEKMLLIASRSGAIFEDGGEVEDVYFVKAIRYLDGDCMDDRQPVYKYCGSSFDPTKAAGTTGLELANCMVVRKRESADSLGDLIASIRNNDDHREEQR